MRFVTIWSDKVTIDTRSVIMVFSTRFIALHHDPDTFLLCFTTLSYDSLRYLIRWQNFHHSAARSELRSSQLPYTLCGVEVDFRDKLYALHYDLQVLFSISVVNMKMPNNENRQNMPKLPHPSHQNNHSRHIHSSCSVYTVEYAEANC